MELFPWHKWLYKKKKKKKEILAFEQLKPKKLQLTLILANREGTEQFSSL